MMDIVNAANILAGSILTGLAVLVAVIVVVAVNNIVHKYWRPVRIFTADSWHFNPPSRFIEPEEKIAPTIDLKKDTK
jgi:hypothetical protein